MQFNELKAGYSIYILDKNEMAVKQCKVTAVGIPHIDSKIGGNPTQMVIDITIENDGKPATYCMRDSLDVSYTGELVLTPNLDILLHEIEAKKAQSEQILASVEHHRDIVGKADILLIDLNPAFKQKKETEARFNKLESSIGCLSDRLEALLKKLD